MLKADDPEIILIIINSTICNWNLIGLLGMLI